MLGAMSENTPYDPPGRRGPVHVGYRRGAASLRQFALVCLLFAAATALIVDDGRDDGMAYVAVVPAAVFVYFTAMAVRAYWRSARGRPLLTLDDDGVTLHSARVTLPWANVAEVKIVTAPAGVRTVIFVARDDDAVLDALRGPARQFAKDGIARVGGPVFARAHDLAMPLEELLSAVHRFTGVPINQRYTTPRLS
jgi:hypothetical protein